MNSKVCIGSTSTENFDKHKDLNKDSENKFRTCDNLRTCDKTPYELVQQIACQLDKLKKKILTEEDKKSLDELKSILKCKLTEKVINDIINFARIIKDLIKLIKQIDKNNSDKNNQPKNKRTRYNNQVTKIREKEYLIKLIGKYNNNLNKFLNYIKKSYNSNTHTSTILKLKMLHNLRFLCKHDSLKFKEHTPIIIEPIIENNIGVETKRINYDGLPINDSALKINSALKIRIYYDGLLINDYALKINSGIEENIEKHKIIFTIPETTLNTNRSNGVKFGFYDLDEFMSFLKCAIEEATHDQLLYDEYFDFSNNVNGSLILEDYAFSIELKIRHGSKVGRINTTSSKIMHGLTKNNLKKSHITSDILSKFNYPELVEYNDLVTKKIFQLINQKHNDPEFPFCTIQCYRETCGHYNTYSREFNNNKLTCYKCRISEFCKLCEKTYHGNTPCNITVDEQTEIWINDNTKACPNSNCKKRIQKNEGCNHMTCKQCSTHFCWLCNQIYTPNDVSIHYRGMNPYDGCINQIQLNNQGNHIQDQVNNIQDQVNDILNQGNNIQDQGNDIHQNDEDDDDVPILDPRDMLFLL